MKVCPYAASDIMWCTFDLALDMPPENRQIHIKSLSLFHDDWKHCIITLGLKENALDLIKLASFPKGPESIRRKYVLCMPLGQEKAIRCFPREGRSVDK